MPYVMDKKSTKGLPLSLQIVSPPKKLKKFSWVHCETATDLSILTCWYNIFRTPAAEYLAKLKIKIRFRMSTFRWRFSTQYFVFKTWNNMLSILLQFLVPTLENFIVLKHCIIETFLMVNQYACSHISCIKNKCPFLRHKLKWSLERFRSYTKGSPSIYILLV